MGTPPPLKPPRRSYKWRRRMRAILRTRDGGLCHWCKTPMVFAEGRPSMNRDENYASIDHVRERRNGGRDDPENLVLAHYRCNSGRDNVKYRAELGVPAIDRLNALRHSGGMA